MRIELVQIEELSGKASKVYSIYIDDNTETELDRLVGSLTDEKLIGKLTDRFFLLKQHCERGGLREDYFKPAGSADDALERINYTGTVRLYGIRYSKLCIILGGGGIKPPDVKTYQEVPELNVAVKILQRIANEIDKRIADREFSFTDDGTIISDPIFIIE
jgi:hypothetical protein